MDGSTSPGLPNAGKGEHDRKEYPNTEVTFRVVEGLVIVEFPQPITFIKMNSIEAREFVKMLEKCITSMPTPPQELI